MPSLRHDMMVHLVRSDPAVILDFCRAQSIELFGNPAVTMEDSNLTVLRHRKLRVDLAMMLSSGTQRHLILVEPQLGRDPEKRASWPGYLLQALHLFGCRIDLVVLTLTATMKAWASRPIAIGSPRMVLTPLVMGPDDIPHVTEPEQVQARPELAVLSYLAHHKGKTGRAIEAALIRGLLALRRHRHKHAAMYLDFATSLMDKSRKAMVEKMWTIDDYKPVGAGKKFYDQGIKAGLAKGRAKGKTEGKAEGRAEGKAEGRAEGKAEALLAVLLGRAVRISRPARARILAERNLALLDQWLARAAVATREADVFGEGATATSGGSPARR